MTVADYRPLLEHIAFIINRAMTGDFKDSAHIDYDRVIRREVESVGCRFHESLYRSECDALRHAANAP